MPQPVTHVVLQHNLTSSSRPNVHQINEEDQQVRSTFLPQRELHTYVGTQPKPLHMGCEGWLFAATRSEQMGAALISPVPCQFIDCCFALPIVSRNIEM
jgi:hypothetical protein